MNNISTNTSHTTLSPLSSSQGATSSEKPAAETTETKVFAATITSNTQNANEKAIEKKVRYLPASHCTEDLWSNKIAFIDLDLYTNPEVRKEAIVIKPFPRSLIPQESITCPPELLNETGLDDITKFYEYVLELIIDPIRFLRALQPIEDAITTKLNTREKPIVFTPEKDAPHYLIQARGFYIPGPAPEGHTPKKKGRLIDEVLGEKERASGINLAGTPTFVGPIEGGVANDFVESDHIFKEDTDISTLLLHGKNAHRLFFQALCESLKGTKYEHLKPTALLKIMVRSKINNPKIPGNVWAYLMDSLADTVNGRKAYVGLYYKLYNTSQYVFSTRSPFVFNSLLLCFGKELGLPNLMHTLLDSHWKSADKMVKRIMSTGTSNAITNVEPITDRNIAYIIAMEALTRNSKGPEDIGATFHFTIRREEASCNEKYKLYPGVKKDKSTLGIRLKLKKDEVLSSNERKAEIFALLLGPAHFKLLMQDEKVHDTIIEFLQGQIITGDYLCEVLEASFENLKDAEGASRIVMLKLLKRMFLLNEKIALMDAGHIHRIFKFVSLYSAFPCPPEYHEFNEICMKRFRTILSDMNEKKEPR